MTRSARLRRGDMRGFTLLELLVSVAIIGILSAMAIPGLRGAMYKARRSALLSNGKTLLGAFTQFNTEVGEYPPCCTPPADALNTRTLVPLTTRGYLPPGSITPNLRNGALTTYDSPDSPTPNNDFYAVMTDRRDAKLQVLVADTDEYPGHVGTNLAGVYLIQGATLIPASDL